MTTGLNGLDLVQSSASSATDVDLYGESEWRERERVRTGTGRTMRECGDKGSEVLIEFRISSVLSESLIGRGVRNVVVGEREVCGSSRLKVDESVYAMVHGSFESSRGEYEEKTRQHSMGYGGLKDQRGSQRDAEGR